MPRRPSADLSMLLVCVIWGINFSVMKQAIAEVPPLAFTAVRFTAASLLLWLVVRLREGPLDLPPGTFWRLVVLGVLGNSCYQLAFILGLVRTTATNSALLIATVPMLVAVLGALLGLERLTPRVWAGIAIATAGVMMVEATSGVTITASTLVGDGLTLLAALSWAGYTVGLRPITGKISPIRITTFTMLTGTPALVVAGLPQLLSHSWEHVGVAGWGGLIYAALFSLTLAYILFNTSVRDVGPSRSAVYLCVTPAVATLVAWVVLGERPRPLQGVGALLILAGVVITRWPGRPRLSS